MPVARLAPAITYAVAGSIVRLNGSASSSDVGALAYSWSFSAVPLGSLLLGSTITSSSDGEIATFEPDRTGIYTIVLSVEDAEGTDAVSAEVDVQPVDRPVGVPTTPDGTFMFRVLSDFWQQVENRQAFPLYWSGLHQILGADFLRLYQQDDAKSIATIQRLIERRWLNYSPFLSLGQESFTALLGPSQSGTTALTGKQLNRGYAVALSATEVQLLRGTVSDTAVGVTLSIVGSATNDGDYTIRAVSPGRAGYRLLSSTPLPDPAATVVCAGSDLVLIAGDRVVSSATDFAAAAVTEGMALRLDTARVAETYLVTAVDGTRLQLDRPLPRTLSRVAYRVLSLLAVNVAFPTSAYTETVYLPETEADLSVFQAAESTGTGTLVGRYEILVARRHVLAAMVGQTLELRSGPNSGLRTTIAALNSAGTGFYVTDAFGGTLPQDARYYVAPFVDVTARLLVLDGQAYPIRRAVLDTSSPEVISGGLGPLWVLTLPPASVPAERSALTWRIGPVLTVPGRTFPAAGVTAGDVLYAEIRLLDANRTAEVALSVMGVYDDRIAFEVGTSVEDGQPGALTDAQISQLCAALEIRTAENDLYTGALVLSGTAARLAAAYTGSAFRVVSENVPFEAGTPFSLSGVRATVRPTGILRNRRVAVDATLRTAPALFEYIQDPRVEETEDGQILQIPTSQVPVRLERPPLVLRENRDFTIGAEDEVQGDDAVLVAEDATVLLPGASLTTRDVRAGDLLEILDGVAAGTYILRDVVSSESVRVRRDDGALPATSDASARYRIVRQQEGTFLRFAEGLFTAAYPAPRSLWAESSFYDNNPRIEANFGTLVGLTEEQFDAYGTEQTSYRGAVLGLMYAWAHGPTLANVELGAHLLLGLPVTEAPSRIVRVDDAYSADYGQVVVEGVDETGTPTGLRRAYTYALPDYAATGMGGIETNPETGQPYAMGDTLPALRPLAKAITLADYVADPDWWLTYGALRGEEVKKYHTWQVDVDLFQVSDQDLTLVAQFLDAVRPVYTKPRLVGVYSLTDAVTVEDDLTFVGSFHFDDDPAHSVESTRMLDDVSGSSTVLRALDTGAVSLRTLFRGRDLVTTTGSIATSARGGFLLPLTAPPNASFPALAARGAGLVREKDLLVILAGTNAGTYQISAVTDTGLTLLPDALSGGADPATWEAASGQEFVVVRRMENPITSGTLTLTAASTIASPAETTLAVDGVTAGDLLIVRTSPTQWYTIAELAVDGATLESGELRLDRPADVDGDYAYMVVRPNLNGATLYTGEGICVGGGVLTGLVSTLGIEFPLARVQAGDEARILAHPLASEVGRIFPLAALLNANTLLLREGSTPLAAGGPVTVQIEHTRAEPDSDATLQLWTESVLEMLVFAPTIVFTTAADVAIAADGTVTSPTLSAAAGLRPDMLFEVLPDPARSLEHTGVYTFGAALDQLSTTFSTNEAGPRSVQVRMPLNEFAVSATGLVTSVTGFAYDGDITAAPWTVMLLPGDLFVYEGGSYYITQVSGSNFQVYPPSAVPGVFSGRIFRTV